MPENGYCNKLSVNGAFPVDAKVNVHGNFPGDFTILNNYDNPLAITYPHTDVDGTSTLSYTATATDPKTHKPVTSQETPITININHVTQVAAPDYAIWENVTTTPGAELNPCTGYTKTYLGLYVGNPDDGTNQTVAYNGRVTGPNTNIPISVSLPDYPAAPGSFGRHQPQVAVYDGSNSNDRPLAAFGAGTYVFKADTSDGQHISASTTVISKPRNCPPGAGAVVPPNASGTSVAPKSSPNGGGGNGGTTADVGAVPAVTGPVKPTPTESSTRESTGATGPNGSPDPTATASQSGNEIAYGSSDENNGPGDGSKWILAGMVAALASTFAVPKLVNKFVPSERQRIAAEAKDAAEAKVRRSNLAARKSAGMTGLSGIAKNSAGITFDDANEYRTAGHTNSSTSLRTATN